MTKQTQTTSFAALGARAGRLMRGEAESAMVPVFLPSDLVRDIDRMSGGQVEQFIGRAIHYVAKEVTHAR